MVDYDQLNEKIKIRRQKQNERLRRDVESGIVNGKILDSGAVIEYKPKGIQNWYTTRQLIERVSDAFERNDGICYINSKWQLQIRGKHLRRLLKAMPNVRQRGRTLIDINKRTPE